MLERRRCLRRLLTSATLVSIKVMRWSVNISSPFYIFRRRRGKDARFLRIVVVNVHPGRL